MRTIGDLATEVNGISNTLLGLSIMCGEGETFLTEGGMCSALAGIADHLSRIVEDLDKLELSEK